MHQLKEIETELKTLDNTLDLLANDHRTKCIINAFYHEKKSRLIEEHELALKELQDILINNGAPEVARLLDKVRSNANDQDIEQELRKVEEESVRKNWAHIVPEIINEHPGSIVKIILKVALGVAHSLEP